MICAARSTTRLRRAPTDHKHTVWFALRGNDARPAFAFPGIWRNYHCPVRKDGPNVELEVYAFLTTTPNPLVGTINHERMPVLLTREEEFETWLKVRPRRPLRLLRSIRPRRCTSCRKASSKKTGSTSPRDRGVAFDV
jgi:putative SOS response-associated peptidase YedK